MRAIAAVGALAAAAGAAAPLTVFPPCGPSHGLALAALSSMPCVRAAQLVAVAFALAAVAWLVVAVRTRGRPLLVGLVAAAAALGLASVLVWPGVCGAPTMACVIGTRPAAIAAASLQLLLAAGAGLALRRAGRSATVP